MSDVAAPRGMLRPPSERPAGKRGVRGTLAAVAALAALLPLTWARVAGETAWGRPVLLSGGTAMIAGAVLLWTARRPATVAAAFGLAVLGAMAGFGALVAENQAESRRFAEEERLGGAVMNEPKASGPRLTQAEAEAVPTGLTRKQLRRRLGAPATYGIQRVTDDPDMPCWGYRTHDSPPNRPALHAFCFRDGRYAELVEW